MKRYFFYAFGEIILVVIGILIAVQINNWNQRNKERMLEIEILQEIRENLQADIEDHERNMYYLNHVVRSCEIVLNHLNDDLPYHDSLASHFSWLPMAANVNPVKSGYQLLQSKGLNIISNDTIRKQIAFLYENEYVWLRDFLKDRQYMNGNPLLNEMMSRFKTFEIMNEAVPRNYEALKRDDDFKVRVQQYAYIIRLTHDRYTQKLLRVNNLVNVLQVEVNRLKAR